MVRGIMIDRYCTIINIFEDKTVVQRLLYFGPIANPTRVSRGSQRRRQYRLNKTWHFNNTRGMINMVVIYNGRPLDMLNSENATINFIKGLPYMTSLDITKHDKPKCASTF